MGYLETQISDLFHKGLFLNKNIVLFNLSNESKIVACTLINRRIMPKGIITLDRKEKYKSIWGITVYSLKEFYSEFHREALVIISDRDYPYWATWFENKGYFKNHKLIVTNMNAPLKNQHFFLPEKLDLILDKFSGLHIYNRIVRRYGNELPIYVYDYDGLGDAYVFGILLKSKYDNNVIVTVRKQILKKVLNMIGLYNIEVLSEKESRFLYKLLELKFKPSNLHPFTPIPLNLHTDILACLYGTKLNMLDIYKVYLGTSFEEKLRLEEFSPIQCPEIDELFIKNNIKEKKAIVLSPFSNSLVSFPYLFWDKLVEELSNIGYQIIINSVGDEYVIPNTVHLDYTIENAPYVVEKAGAFIGIRSGFCDLISNTNALKLIINPKMEKINFNNNIFNAFSFSKMNIGKNIIEFEWDYDNYLELIQIICFKLKQTQR